jgi:hypothetical protein
MGAKQKYRNAEQLVTDIQKVTKFVLCGLQKTNFPISYPEQKPIDSCQSANGQEGVHD